MVKTDLTSEMISAGADLLWQLEQSKFQVVAGLWLYSADANRWRLLIASPKVRIKGPQVAYRTIQVAMRRLKGTAEAFSLGDITVVKDDDPLVRSLRKAVLTHAGVAGIRFSQNSINGHFIEDAYIYRVQWLARGPISRTTRRAIPRSAGERGR